MRHLIAAINGRRIDRYYRAALSDGAVAQAWTGHYLAGLDFNGHARVLDYGCGRGRVSAILRQRGWRVVGLDIQAHPWWQDLGGAGFVVTGPMAPHAPFSDGAFDLVLNVDSTHYYDSRHLRQHAGEIFRVLRPGGHWVVVQANPEAYGGSLIGVAPPGQLHSLADARRIAEAAGFIEVDHWFEGLASPIAPLWYMRARHAIRPWPLYMDDHGSPLAKLLPPRKRHRWVLRVQTPRR